jgi:hypothetical protein
VRRVLQPLAILVLASFLPGQSGIPKATFDAGAVWQPKQADAENTWNDMRQCGAMHAGGSPGTFEVCTGDAMRKHGASEKAIAFNAATGGNSYATRFIDYGRVDVMEAMNPFMANSNDQVFFVNGDPVAVGADEKAMKLDGKSDPQFRALKKKFPDAFIFPHAEMQKLMATATKDGGQAFTVQFPVVDGCHACARVGQTTIEYDFDASGRFTGAKITGTLPLPPKP